MNTNHDELERLLGDELHDRAGDIGGARLHFGDVRGRATSIRRGAGSRLGPVRPPLAVASPYRLAIRRRARTRTSPPASQEPHRHPAGPPTLARTDADARRPAARRRRRGSSTSPASTARWSLPGEALRPWTTATGDRAVRRRRGWRSATPGYYAPTAGRDGEASSRATEVQSASVVSNAGPLAVA